MAFDALSKSVGPDVHDCMSVSPSHAGILSKFYHRLVAPLGYSIFPIWIKCWAKFQRSSGECRWRI